MWEETGSQAPAATWATGPRRVSEVPVDLAQRGWEWERPRGLWLPPMRIPRAFQRTLTLLAGAWAAEQGEKRGKHGEGESLEAEWWVVGSKQEMSMILASCPGPTSSTGLTEILLRYFPKSTGFVEFLSPVKEKL